MLCFLITWVSRKEPSVFCYSQRPERDHYGSLIWLPAQQRPFANTWSNTHFHEYWICCFHFKYFVYVKQVQKVLERIFSKEIKTGEFRVQPLGRNRWPCSSKLLWEVGKSFEQQEDKQGQRDENFHLRDQRPSRILILREWPNTDYDSKNGKMQTKVYNLSC